VLYSRLFMLDVGNCAQTTNPHIFLNGSCFVYTTKDYHQDHDGKCTSWNEVSGTNYSHVKKTYCFKLAAVEHNAMVDH